MATDFDAESTQKDLKDLYEVIVIGSIRCFFLKTWIEEVVIVA